MEHKLVVLSIFLDCMQASETEGCTHAACHVMSCPHSHFSLLLLGMAWVGQYATVWVNSILNMAPQLLLIIKD